MNPSDRVRLVVLFGGRSAEHDVSCVSALHVLRAADSDRYVLDAIGITRDGQWLRPDSLADLVGLSGRAGHPTRDGLEAAGTAVEPLAAIRPQAPDHLPLVVFPLLHGPHGEDGTVQGLLEMAGVPFVGSGVLGSALCMDKRKANEVLRANGLPQANWIGVRDTELDDVEDRLGSAGLTYPLFVKPANMGSSVGVSRVVDRSQLTVAVTGAAAYDEWIVVEEGVRARELEVAVLGNAQPRASLPGEVVPTRDFYDYEDKYVDGAAQLLIPADLPRALTDEIRQLALTTFSVLSCDGMARVDFFYESAGRGLLVNEVNTIPGFTPISMYPKLWEASGVSHGELVDELVRLAMERHERRARFSTKH